MFELTPVGVPIALVGLLYMVLIGRHLVPDRIPEGDMEDAGNSLYLFEILIPKGSTLAGQTLYETGLGRDLDLKVLRVVRERGRYVVPRASTTLKEEDVLLVEGPRRDILRIEDRAAVKIRPAVWLLSAFFLLTVLLTQPMSNQASAAVVLPVAFNTAQQLNLDPRSFGIMIALAASCSFLTPLEPVCLLVYGPGRYRFFDFPRVGFLLSILIYLIAILMVPWLWPA
jgi:di/tricarboxylate transporter